ncbi:two-component sensor histidine kinase [Planococcus maritimus]|uniref:sensor histidine kinase n=1 Tax=Planococcus maritimus TaxID=192421 RepID=UPI00084C684C|nr:HAMP domain-containing sensor histidine kinase [Planococcus maritimus]OED31764.1 two-component sensor histidine kinase [Planococcus maritimus]
MLRNREIRWLLVVLITISALGTILSTIFVSTTAAWVVLGVALLLSATAITFTWWRYREIERLSGFLQQISSGDFQLDVRDNREGELSLLKTQIYKVTKMLSEHGALLTEDKGKLTNAISDISHQLKTPLTSMMVMADLLRDSDLNDAKRSEFIRNLHTQLERMDWLVSSLLKLSKIDAGTIHFKRDRIPVSKLIEKAVEPLLIPMDINMQDLEIEGDPEAEFNGDLNWTTEALINILKNCVEHTGEGGTLTIRYNENALYTGIQIEDSGSGISKKDLPYIFKRFYKGENAGDDSVGIGLAMAYSIITSQSGDIEVASNPGEGTRFHIKFYKQVV